MLFQLFPFDRFIDYWSLKDKIVIVRVCKCHKLKNGLHSDHLVILHSRGMVVYSFGLNMRMDNLCVSQAMDSA